MKTKCKIIIVLYFCINAQAHTITRGIIDQFEKGDPLVTKACRFSIEGAHPSRREIMKKYQRLMSCKKQIYHQALALWKEYNISTKSNTVQGLLHLEKMQEDNLRELHKIYTDSSLRETNLPIEMGLYSQFLEYEYQHERNLILKEHMKTKKLDKDMKKFINIIMFDQGYRCI